MTTSRTELPYHDQWSASNHSHPSRSMPGASADTLGKGNRAVVLGRLRTRSWETPEGDKRTVTEIDADEVGASLKFATAKVERAHSRGSGERASKERTAERGDFNDPAPF